MKENTRENQTENPKTILAEPARLKTSASDHSARAATTVPAKYIFLDIVDFTKDRSVEAQTDIVHILNNIINS